MGLNYSEIFSGLFVLLSCNSNRFTLTKSYLKDDLVAEERITLGPFIRGKIRRELCHLYEHVLSKSSVYLNVLLKCKFIIRR